MKYTKRKYLIPSALFLIVIMFSITYAVFNFSKTGTTENVVTTGTVSMTYTESENGITLNNAMPLTDEEGKVLTEENQIFDFTIDIAVGDKEAVAYEVTAEKLVSSTMNDNDVKLYLLKSNDGINYEQVDNPKTYSGINENDSYGAKNGEMILDSDVRNASTTVYYRLKMWPAKEHIIDSTSRSFSIKVNVYGKDTEYVADSYEFDYTGGEQTFTVPKTGTYKLEVWGASGGDSGGMLNNVIHYGGYGGYSVGTITLAKSDTLYINVGGEGVKTRSPSSGISGSYNGGGDMTLDSYRTGHGDGTGGGASHIAMVPGVLSTLEGQKGTLTNNSYYISDKILIVAGGGGGAGDFYWSGNGTIRYANGGSGGGYKGGELVEAAGQACDTTGGTQTTAGRGCMNAYFGKGGSCSGGSSGGGGFYGGGCANGGTGGSGYIASSKLISSNNIEKHMTCYNCDTSDDTETKTLTTTNVSEEATSDYSKIGNGYARITLIK